MFRRLTFGLSLLAVAMLVLILHTPSNAQGSGQARRSARATAAPTSSGFPDDAKPLDVDKPLTDSLDDATAIRFYKFSGKTGEIYRLSVEVKTGNFWTNTTIASTDFTRVLAATEGDDLIDASMRVVIPESGVYGVTIEYIDPTIGTPAAGNFTVTLSKVAPK